MNDNVKLARGAYEIAKEEVARLIKRRRSLCVEVGEIVNATESYDARKPIGVEKVRDLIDQIAEIDNELGRHVVEMNENAMRAGKPPYSPRYHMG